MPMAFQLCTNVVVVTRMMHSVFPAISSSLIFVILLLHIHVAAAIVASPGSPTQNVCHSLLTDANATGGGNSSWSSFNSLGQWLVGVKTNYSADTIVAARSDATQNSPDAAINIWLDPYMGVDLNDYENPYSACAFVFKSLPFNTILRGQGDDGTCEQTLSKKCISDLTDRAALTATWLTANPTIGPFSNLTVRHFSSSFPVANSDKLN